MSRYPLTNFEIKKHYQTNLNLMVFIQKNDLPKIRDGAYVINLDDYK